MGRISSGVKNGLTALAVIIATLNVESVASALKVDKLLLHPGVVGAVATLIGHPATLLAAMFVIGVFVGTWVEKISDIRRTPKADPSLPMRSLGIRMRNCAGRLAHLQQWGDIGSTDQEQREAIAELNGLMVDAQRMGLATPPGGAAIGPIITYLTEVGNWLSRGDIDIAKERASNLANARD
jgi:hypothetical protein